MKIEDYCQQELEQKKAANGFRSIKEVHSTLENGFSINQKNLVNFCSNDYLGLSQHAEVIAKSVEFSQQYGSGSGASPLVCGHSEPHRLLEMKLASWKMKESAMLFSSGYAANVGVLSNLMKKGGLILGDKKNHASLIDGSQLSTADFRTYHHNDMDSLEKILMKKRHQYRNVLIVSDAVFSMDGDIADLKKLCLLARQYDSWTFIDEAHATGVIGSHGEGLVSHLNLQSDVDIVMGTLSKSLGSQGGYIVCNAQIKSFLINQCRSYIYSTSLSPAACGAAIGAIDLLQRDNSLIEKLKENCFLFSIESGLKSSSSIFPYIIGAAKETLAAEKYFASKGFYVQSIRPPTVPLGTSRLRITIRANHALHDIKALALLISGYSKMATPANNEIN